jgi:hypothetical protein
MRRHSADLIKTAQKLLADYGIAAEEEAAERAVLLDAIGSHKEAEVWLAIADHVAAIRQQRAVASAA